MVPLVMVFIGFSDFTLHFDLSALLTDEHGIHIDVDHFLTVDEFFLVSSDIVFESIDINDLLGIKDKVSDLITF